jgi:hypothetical protein
LVCALRSGAGLFHVQADGDDPNWLDLALRAASKASWEEYERSRLRGSETVVGYPV